MLMFLLMKFDKNYSNENWNDVKIEINTPANIWNTETA
jgi:hypothetical protein